MFTCTNCNGELPDTEFYVTKKRDGTHRYRECKTCFKTRLNDRHNQIKETLVQEHGGACKHCGYNRSHRVLQFHHLDPNEKDFGIGSKPGGNIDNLRKEAAKCILLCPNCHHEKHLGLW